MTSNTSLPLRARVNAVALEVDTAALEQAMIAFVEKMLSSVETESRANPKIGLMVQALKGGLHLGLPILQLLINAGAQDEQMMHEFPLARAVPSIPALPRHADIVRHISLYFVSLILSLARAGEWVIDVDAVPTNHGTLEGRLKRFGWSETPPDPQD